MRFLILTITLLVGSSTATLAQDREVFIYYANESAPEGQELENLQLITGWLISSGIEKASAQAKALLDDGPRFCRTVDLELENIFKYAKQAQIPVVAFTNREFRKGWFQCFDPTKYKASQRIVGRKIESTNYIESANPLATQAGLLAALEATAVLYPPSDHRFVLLTKSHGSAQQPLTVRLPRRHEDISQEALVKSLRGEPVEVEPVSIGTSQEDYFETLDRIGRQQGMKFSLVFIESCLGDFSPKVAQALPKNVDICFASGDRFLQYQTLDYELLFGGLSGESGLSESMSKFLKPRYLSMYREQSESTRSFRGMVMFVCGVLVIAQLWVLFLRIRARSKICPAKDTGKPDVSFAKLSDELPTRNVKK